MIRRYLITFHVRVTLSEINFFKKLWNNALITVENKQALLQSFDYFHFEFPSLETDERWDFWKVISVAQRYKRLSKYGDNNAYYVVDHNFSEVII